MHIRRSVLEISGIPVEVLRKPIKHLHLTVYPPDGRVRVSAPRHLDDEAVQAAILDRLGWIRRKQEHFQAQTRPAPSQFICGETHYVAGQGYALDVVERAGPPEVRLLDNVTLELGVRPDTRPEKRAEILQEWYRDRLRGAIPDLIEKWEPVMGVAVAEWRIKRMKTRWGTCNIRARRIWFNLELAKYAPACLEYIVVHEMAHLLERLHNRRFWGLMDQFLPHWRLLREDLKRGPGAP